MRIPSGVTDQYIYFVAVDSTDFTTRETGLTTFTVYRSRNGAAAAAMTTPTVNEVDSTNMPGVYELLLDEDMTIGSGNDSEEMVFHITQADMAPVTRAIELYRPKVTAGQTLAVTSGRGDADVLYWNAAAVAAPDTAGYPKITVKSGTGTGELNLSSGRTDANVAYWSGSAVASVDTAGYPVVTVKDGTGAGEIDLANGKPSVDLRLVLGTALTQTSVGRVAGNMSTFWDNADAATSKVVDNVGGSLSTADKESIADTVLGRSVTFTESTHTVDCLRHLILNANHSQTSGTTLTTYETDDSTTYATQTLAVSVGADPIIGSSNTAAS